MASTRTPTTISFVNLKGGVGKTALSVNFAGYCGRKGLHTLLVDLDPQTNSTLSCMSFEKWQTHAEEKGTVANLLGARDHTNAEGTTVSASDVIVRSVFENVDLIPSHLDLFTIDLDLGSDVARETRLRRALREIRTEYDVIICDCPPNLTIPTQNAVAISDYYVVPVSPDFLSGIGVALLLTRVKKLSEALENPIELAGIVMSRVGRPSYFRSQTIQTLRQTFPDSVFESVVNERSAVSESAALNKLILDMGDAAASSEFTKLGNELLDAVGLA